MTDPILKPGDMGMRLYTCELPPPPLFFFSLQKGEKVLVIPETIMMTSATACIGPLGQLVTSFLLPLVFLEGQTRPMFSATVDSKLLKAGTIYAVI